MIGEWKILPGHELLSTDLMTTKEPYKITAEDEHPPADKEHGAARLDSHNHPEGDETLLTMPGTR